MQNSNPIHSIKEDRFNRSGFARSIAEICEIPSGESRIIGLYGKWGEGKSSLLNMVGDVLDKEILQVHFNPWIFKNEDDLLLAFFRLLAEQMGGKLATKKEMIFRAISDYGEAVGIIEDVPIIGSVAKAGKSATKLFKPSDITSEKAKKRINKLIIDSGLTIVIFFDDIDRLDSREVVTVFKLVKLLADFPRTTYLLSFDPEIIAKMLAPSYGGQVPESGYQYLEKVIQLPLVVPLAHEEDLVTFLKEALNKVATENQIGLEKENEKLTEYLADGLLILLDSPRKISRYAGSLQFSLSILKEEVDIGDLILLEAFRAGFPELYSFIKANKELVLSDYIKQRPDFGENRNYANERIKAVIQSYPLNVRDAIKKLTCHLFPKFFWMDPSDAKHFSEEDLVINKRISSNEYFDRYFTFSLLDHVVPDGYFKKVYLEAGNWKQEELLTKVEADLAKYSIHTILKKIAFHRNTITGIHADNLVNVICLLSHRMKVRDGFDFGSSVALASLSIITMIKSFPMDEALEKSIRAIKISSGLHFAAELVAKLVMPISAERPETVFSGMPALRIKQAYIDRLRDQVLQQGFFEAVPEEMMVRQLVWWYDCEPEEIRRLSNDLLNEDKTSALKMLRIFTPTIYAITDEQGKVTPVKADFTETEFERLDKIVGTDKIYQLLTETHGDFSYTTKVGVVGFRDALDDETLVGVFQKLYKLKNGLYDYTINEVPRRD